jgi:hypothetical protein
VGQSFAELVLSQLDSFDLHQVRQTTSNAYQNVDNNVEVFRLNFYVLPPRAYRLHRPVDLPL